MSGFCVGGRLPYGELFSSLEAGRNEVVLDLNYFWFSICMSCTP